MDLAEEEAEEEKKEGRKVNDNDDKLAKKTIKGGIRRG